jgi:hypothetical protein
MIIISVTITLKHIYLKTLLVSKRIMYISLIKRHSGHLQGSHGLKSSSSFQESEFNVFKTRNTLNYELMYNPKENYTLTT